jgi:hypothetical protein
MLAQLSITISTMETKRLNHTPYRFADRGGPHFRAGARHVEKVWSDASSCAAHVDAGGAREGARNRAAMIVEQVRR